jgi:Flp pilus assembly pilin Flp
MKSGFWNLAFLLRNLRDQEDGQDLVEYALVVALVGLGGFVGVESAARGILQFFQGVISVIDTNFP